MTTFWLPCPPSVNGLYDGGIRSKRRFKSKPYQRWIKAAGWTLNAVPIAERKPVHGAVKVRYEFARCRKGSDVANREKALSDLLVSHRIIDDDSLIEECIVGWVDDIPNGVRVTIEEWNKGINDP